MQVVGLMSSLNMITQEHCGLSNKTVYATEMVDLV